MNAGTSTNQNQTRTALSLALLVLFVGLWSVAPIIGQAVLPVPKAQFLDDNGNPCAGCKLYAYAAGTTTPQDTYTTYALSVANANPVVLDAAGRATVFLDSTLNYKFNLKTAADVDIWTVDNIQGQLAGIIVASAANTRGVQITRAGAASGLSIASTGGSGKTWGLESTTTGELKIQDDADGSPAIQLGAGNAISLKTTGTFTFSDGGSNEWARIDSSGHLGVGTNTPECLFTVNIGATAEGNCYGQTIQSTREAATGQHLAFVRKGNSIWSLGFAYNTNMFAVGAGQGTDSNFTAAAAALTIDNTTKSVQAPSQPGFLAYNSAADTGIAATGATVEFDTEVYDIGSNFNNTTDTFTAPIMGYYLLCATVTALNSAGTGSVRIVTSNRTYYIGSTGASYTTQSGCVVADMDAADTASVATVYGGGTGDVNGGGSPYVTFFSGRLML